MDGSARIRANRLAESPEVLTDLERVEAQHRVRNIDDAMLAFVRALSPATGMMTITRTQFGAQVASLERQLHGLKKTYAPEDTEARL